MLELKSTELKILLKKDLTTMRTDELEVIKKIWQSQNMPEVAIDLNAQNEILNKMAAYEKHVKTRTVLKGAAIILILLGGLFLFSAGYFTTFVRIVGFLILLVVSCIFLFYNWRKSFRLSSFDFAMNSLDFTGEAVKRLKGEKKLLYIISYIVIAIILIGLNLFIDGTGFPTLVVIKTHIIISGIYLTVALIKLRIKQIDYNNRVVPIINSLENLQKELNKE
jgi:hypothetical protein